MSKGTNSDIDNKSNPDQLLLRMLDCLRPRFNHNLTDHLWKQKSSKGLNHEQKKYLPMFLTRIQIQETVFVARIDV